VGLPFPSGRGTASLRGDMDQRRYSARDVDCLTPMGQSFQCSPSRTQIVRHAANRRGPRISWLADVSSRDLSRLLISEHSLPSGSQSDLTLTSTSPANHRSLDSISMVLPLICRSAKGPIHIFRPHLTTLHPSVLGETPMLDPVRPEPLLARLVAVLVPEFHGAGSQITSALESLIWAYILLSWKAKSSLRRR
jgi:hypothetical protein